MKRLISILLLLFLLIQPVMADEVNIKFKSALTQGRYSYFYGEGLLKSNYTGYVNTDFNAELISYDGLKFQDGRVYAENPQMMFLVSKPSGHGLYTADFMIPEVDEGTDDVTIEIKSGKMIFFSNVDFEVEESGEFLKLHAVTDKSHVKFYFITEAAYMLISDFIAAGIFTVALLSYLVVKRKEVVEVLKSRFRSFRVKVPANVEEYEGGYTLNLKFGRIGKPIEVVEEGLKFRIPYWLISGALIIFLAIVFVESITRPLREHWNMVGVLGYGVLVAGGLVGVLAALLLLSSPNDESFIRRISLIGGGLVGVVFGYLGWLAVVLFAATSLLIYYVSKLILK